jgi:uncharacterized protein YlaN (UPF0358 family)
MTQEKRTEVERAWSIMKVYVNKQAKIINVGRANWKKPQCHTYCYKNEQLTFSFTFQEIYKYRLTYYIS